ncbi:MAG: glycosyltransferase [Ruminococcaceae bacterium]|nr:glycosyltransferase [Oscillospiraceae bacterium]
MARVSIIMGIYNCADTLSEAIDSIINQTYSDWQLILCEDGSTDNTYEIAESYLRLYPEKIVLLKNNVNKGLNYTLNRCLAAATGDYVARMDGDDVSLPTRLEKEVVFLDEHPEYSIVSTPMIFFDENGDWGRSYQIEAPTRKDFIKHSPVHCHAPCMIRREAYVAVGGYTEDKRMLRFEDVNLWYKLYSKGYAGYNLSEPLYKMRDDQEATSRRGLKSRMNGVYVTYVGFKLFGFPWYMYGYVVIDFLKHFVKGIMPQRLYMKFHKKTVRQW